MIWRARTFGCDTAFCGRPRPRTPDKCELREAQVEVERAFLLPDGFPNLFLVLPFTVSRRLVYWS
jgi:hypothetical protein